MLAFGIRAGGRFDQPARDFAYPPQARFGPVRVIGRARTTRLFATRFFRNPL
jgi:hypothetical protein